MTSSIDADEYGRYLTLIGPARVRIFPNGEVGIAEVYRLDMEGHPDDGRRFYNLVEALPEIWPTPDKLGG